MAAIADADISIDNSGAIRWTGAATTPRHSVLEFIQLMQDKQDDEQAAGDILLDITVDTPFDRSTDQIVALNSPFNIDATFASHLYDGSVSQTNPTFGGEDLFSGLELIGPVVAGTEYMVLQNGKVIAAFWGTGINAPPAPTLVFSRHLVQSKLAGAQIDGRRITVLARELGDQFRRFPVTLGTGNSVAAIGNGADIFNTTPDATIAGWTTITNVEGFQELDIDKTGAAGQEYYSQWAKAAQSINDTYERTKWISQRSHIADSNAEGAEDFIIDDNNTTSVGVGSEWSATAAGEVLTELVASIKIGAGTAHTGTLYALLYDSDDVATAAPTGAILARSEPILASAITSSYEDIIFRFNLKDPSDGSDQAAGLVLVADQEYFFVLKHDEGSATDYFHAEGDTTTADDGNFARETPPATFTGVGTSALQFTVKTSPAIHGVPGELMQGISVEVGYDGEIGTGVAEDNIVMWGTKVNYDGLTGGPFFAGEPVTFRAEGDSSLKTGGIVLYDDLTDELIVALDTPGAAVIDDNDLIEGLVSAATAAINVAGGAILDEDKGGGTGILLAKDDNGAAGELYLQVLTGIDPVDDNTIRRDDASGDPLLDLCLATAVINPKTINPEFLGTSTGSNIIGAYGIGFDPDDVGASDRFISLDDAPRTPPNNVAFTISALVSGEDRVLVAPRSGTVIDEGQWLLATALTTGTEVAVVVKTGTETVPFVTADINWPTTGKVAEPAKLRIQLDSNIRRHIDYESHDAVDTFTILSTSFTGANSAAVNRQVYLAFIDVLADATTESFTGVHDAQDRDLFVRVRDGGGTPIKTFESVTAQFLATPVTVAAVRTSDA